MQVELLDVSDSRWPERLAEMGPYDFYHLPDFLDLEGSHTGAVPRAAVVSNDDCMLFLPLLQREIDIPPLAASYFDVTGPYGYGSPLFTSPIRDDAQRKILMRAALDTLKDYLAERGVIALFVRLHPLLPIPIPELDPHVEALVPHGKTVYVDLTLPEEEQWSNIGSSSRKKIKKARRGGLVALVDDDWSYLDPFIDIYNITMDRVDAGDTYRYAKTYFEGMRDRLGDVMRLSVVLRGEQPVAASLFSETNGIVQFHLGGALRDPELNRLGPERLITDLVRRETSRRGNRVFHLGGGVGAADDSLLQFKLSFSPLTRNFSTLRMVLDPGVYDRLAREWEQQAREPVDGLTGFFPAYRKELPRKEEGLAHAHAE